MCWRRKSDIRFQSVGKQEWVAGSREVSSSKAGTSMNWNQPEHISRRWSGNTMECDTEENAGTIQDKVCHTEGGEVTEPRELTEAASS